METLRFKKVDKDAKAPTRSNNTDAGLDLYTKQKEIIPIGENVLVDTGIAFDIPDGYMLQLCARSSLPLKKKLLLANGVGIIDQDYTGKVKAQLLNLTDEPISLDKHEKFCQVILIKVETPEPVEVSDLKTTSRGDNGFGSTGK